MNVISPVTAVLAAIVPVVRRRGRSASGRRSSAWVGIALGLARRRARLAAPPRTTRTDGSARACSRSRSSSGVGFGLYFVFLARAGHDSGLWPLLVSRVASAIAIVPLAAAMRVVRARCAGRCWRSRCVAGVCDALANLFFLLAARARPAVARERADLAVPGGDRAARGRVAARAHQPGAAGRAGARRRRRSC